MNLTLKFPPPLELQKEIVTILCPPFHTKQVYVKLIDSALHEIFQFFEVNGTSGI